MRVDVQGEKSSPLAIEQRVHFADDRSHKYRLLDHLLADTGMGQSIVFIATKRDAEALAVKLQGEGHAAAALHGDMNQFERNRTLANMRRGGVRTLVATDVAARGIDVPGISHVINFDLPRQAEDYVHRIGRTGRAGASGIAVSFANHAERGTLRNIERFTGAAIPAHTIPGLEPRARSSSAGETRAVPRMASPRHAAGRMARRRPLRATGSPAGSASAMARPAASAARTTAAASGEFSLSCHPARRSAGRTWHPPGESPRADSPALPPGDVRRNGG